MADELRPSTISEAAADPAVTAGRPEDPHLLVHPATGAPAPYQPEFHGYPETFHGRRVSWVAVITIMVGFLIGGLALVFGPTWWLFWTAAAIAAVGGLLALAVNIFDDWY
jgi:hypothetical protein